jgi:hypothetical protein
MEKQSISWSNISESELLSLCHAFCTCSCCSANIIYMFFFFCKIWFFVLHYDLKPAHVYNTMLSVDIYMKNYYYKFMENVMWYHAYKRRAFNVLLKYIFICYVMCFRWISFCFFSVRKIKVKFTKKTSEFRM